MAKGVIWSGLDELKLALQTLPTDLAEFGSEIVDGAADRAAWEIRAAYPARTGNLRKGVKLRSVRRGALVVGTQVINTAPHATIFEAGTQARHYFTTRGVKHLTGAMPPGRVFVPIVVRRRRGMYDQLRSLLERFGLLVSGAV